MPDNKPTDEPTEDEQRQEAAMAFNNPNVDITNEQSLKWSMDSDGQQSRYWTGKLEGQTGFIAGREEDAWEWPHYDRDMEPQTSRKAALNIYTQKELQEESETKTATNTKKPLIAYKVEDLLEDGRLAAIAEYDKRFDMSDMEYGRYARPISDLAMENLGRKANENPFVTELFSPEKSMPDMSSSFDERLLAVYKEDVENPHYSMDYAHYDFLSEISDIDQRRDIINATSNLLITDGKIDISKVLANLPPKHLTYAPRERPYTSILEAVKIADRAYDGHIDALNSATITEDRETPANVPALIDDIAVASLFNPALRDRIERGTFVHSDVDFTVKQRAAEAAAKYSPKEIEAHKYDAVLDLVDGQGRKDVTIKHLNQMEVTNHGGEYIEAATNVIPPDEHYSRHTMHKGEQLLNDAVTNGSISSQMDEKTARFAAQSLAKFADKYQDAKIASIPLSRLGTTIEQSNKSAIYFQDDWSRDEGI